jgi:hypothetical protein
MHECDNQLKTDLDAIDNDVRAYNDLLNFSSEIEFDEQFQAD